MSHLTDPVHWRFQRFTLAKPQTQNCDREADHARYGQDQPRFALGGFFVAPFHIGTEPINRTFVLGKLSVHAFLQDGEPVIQLLHIG